MPFAARAASATDPLTKPQAVSHIGLLSAAAAPAPTAPVAAAAVGAAVAVNQCDGTDNVGGLAVECHVTVTNNLDLATGLTSSTLELVECHGAANAAARFGA